MLFGSETCLKNKSGNSYVSKSLPSFIQYEQILNYKRLTFKRRSVEDYENWRKKGGRACLEVQLDSRYYWLGKSRGVFEYIEGVGWYFVFGWRAI